MLSFENNVWLPWQFLYKDPLSRVTIQKPKLNGVDDPTPYKLDI